MGNIIPLDVNVVSAVTNKQWRKSDRPTEWGRACAWMLMFRGC